MISWAKYLRASRECWRQSTTPSVAPRLETLERPTTATALRRPAADAPRELSAALVAELAPPLLAIEVAVRRIVDALDDVPEPALALVVELDGKVGEVGHERAAEGSRGGEGDEAFVLRPLGLGRVDCFLQKVKKFRRVSGVSSLKSRKRAVERTEK